MKPHPRNARRSGGVTDFIEQFRSYRLPLLPES